ncbi:MAG: 16S rRNA (uracil(1498)-N(3))-methyltransferase [Stappiaceae bacterium]
MQRLFLHHLLAANARIEADRGQVNYLINVLRLKDGDQLLVFNGKDGEWLAEIGEATRRSCVLNLRERTRTQTGLPDLHYLFAPLKQARLDYMVQKAVEMGAGTLRPVMTQHTQSSRINVERMEANVREACEQCGIISIPQVRQSDSLVSVIDGWRSNEGSRQLIFCDEAEPGQQTLSTLEKIPAGPLAVLIGPEGGFSAEERQLLRAQSFVTPLPLGPRILRADTAAVAALAVIQAGLGDWR